MIEGKDLIRLGWEILAHKSLYYYWCSPILDDTEYDILEKIYEKSSGITTDVGLNQNRAAVQLIISGGIAKAREFVNETLESRRTLINNHRLKAIRGEI